VWEWEISSYPALHAVSRHVFIKLRYLFIQLHHSLKIGLNVYYTLTEEMCVAYWMYFVLAKLTVNYK